MEQKCAALAPSCGWRNARAFRKALKALEPLPNLDFKIRRASSLVDHIHGEPVELSALSRETGAAVPLSKLVSAKREFFNAHTAAAKRRLRLDIVEALTKLARIELTGPARTPPASASRWTTKPRAAWRNSITA
jgi:hypothetical protein